MEKHDGLATEEQAALLAAHGRHPVAIDDKLGEAIALCACKTAYYYNCLLREGLEPFIAAQLAKDFQQQLMIGGNA